MSTLIHVVAWGAIVLVHVAMFAMIVMEAGGASCAKALRMRRRVRRLPVTAVGSLPKEGAVAVCGRAVGREAEAPFIGLPCLFWQVELLDLRGARRALYRSTAPFEIDDGTGRAMLLPENAEPLRSDDALGGGEPVTEAGGSFLREMRRRDIPLPWRDLRGRIWFVRKGDRLFSLGQMYRFRGHPLLGSVPGYPLLLSKHSREELLAQYDRTVSVQMISSVVTALVLGAIAAIVILHLLK
jgi:hypothetical protein